MNMPFNERKIYNSILENKYSGFCVSMNNYLKKY